jgi:hypothetical protein
MTSALVQLRPSGETGPLIKRAIEELQDYLPQVWFTDVYVGEAPHRSDTERVDLTISLGTVRAEFAHELARLDVELPCDGAQGYLVRSVTAGESAGSHLYIVGADDEGVLNGCYAFLEAIGLRFYLSGESCPPRGPLVAPHLDLRAVPAVRLRGFMPYTDFLAGPSVWDAEDYVAVIDRAARLRLNLFSMHFYTFEPVGQFSFKNVERTEAFWDTSRTTRWHKRPGKISDFIAGRELFSDYQISADTFGSRAAIEATSSGERFKLAESDIRAAFEHAARRGMHTSIGVEITDPPLEFRALVDPSSRFGDDGFGICPSSPDARELIGSWLASLVTSFPTVDTYTLWQTENGPSRWTAGCPCATCVEFRRSHPLPAYSIDDLLGKVSREIYDVANIVSSEQTFLQWALLAYELMQEIAPGKQVAISGWYIEHMFRDAAAYLPSDMVFTSITEVDPWEAPPQLDHYEAVPQPTWLINWWEIDFRMWLPQPKISAYPAILEKVRRYNIDGIIWQHWRTRSVDDNARFTSLAMWDAKLTPEAYYWDSFATEWGEKAADDATAALLLLEVYERWLSHDLGWQVFAQDWFPPTINQVLESLAVHGAIPDRILSDVAAKLAKLPELRDRLLIVQERLKCARSKAVVLRAVDRPAFWEKRIDFYLLYLDCLGHIGEAGLAFGRASRGAESIASQTEALRETYTALRQAPVKQFITSLAESVYDKGDLGTLVNLNNELWQRYREALSAVTRWFTDAGVGGMWTLRIRGDGTLAGPVVGPDALLPDGQWSEI